MTNPDFHNPLLDEDDDEPILTSPTAGNLPRFRVSPSTSQPMSNAVDTAPKFGEKGFRKGVPNPRAGSPRAHVTAANAPLLAFGAKFPGATAEAFSMIRLTKASNVSTGGRIPTVGSTLVVLSKLRKLGMMESYRREGSKAVQWATTEKGISAAREHGYLDSASEAVRGGLAGMAFTRMDHYRYIALVAAQFMNPRGVFRELLGVGPMALENLIGEQQVRREQKGIATYLTDKAKKDKGEADFGKWRKEQLDRAVEEVKAGKLAWNELLEAYPALRTVGLAKSETVANGKGTHWPDLVVSREHERTGARSPSIMVEIELHPKRWDEYEQLLLTYKKELDRPFIYSRVVYFAVGKNIERLLRKLDERHGYELFASGKLIVIPLTHRDGEPVSVARRIGEQQDRIN